MITLGTRRHRPKRHAVRPDSPPLSTGGNNHPRSAQYGRARKKQIPISNAGRDRKRRQILIEGSFADAANNHGFKRSRWRRLWRQQIQDWLIAENVRTLLKATKKKDSGAMALIAGGFASKICFFDVAATDAYPLSYRKGFGDGKLAIAFGKKLNCRRGKLWKVLASHHLGNTPSTFGKLHAVPTSAISAPPVEKKIN